MGIADTEFCELALAICNECDRLGWNKYTRNGWFKDNYSVRSPWVLENEVLADALAKLRNIGGKSQSYPLVSSKNWIEDREGLAFDVYIENQYKKTFNKMPDAVNYLKENS